MKSIYKILVLLLMMTVASSCDKTIDVNIPAGVFTTETVFNTNDAAQAAMRGIYQSMTNILSSCPFEGILTGTIGLGADELVRANYSTEQQQFFDNNIFPDNSAVANIWAAYYSYIYQANNLYEAAERSPGLSTAQKDALMGEARFIRALSFFYLTNLYNKVPLVLTSNYINNALLPVSDQKDIYNQIIIDLKFAQSKAGTNNTVAGSRYRGNKWAATALLARVYLYQKDWANAETEASAVIAQSTTYQLDALENVFLAASKEAIWALANPGTNLYCSEGTSISGSSSANSSCRMTPYLVGQFKTGDQRLSKWGRLGGTVSAPNTAPLKYKTFSNTDAGAKKEASTVLRLAEQYLIRAEARAMQNNLTGAIADVDAIRIRAGAVANESKDFKTIGYASPNISQKDLLAVIYNERLLELFSEYGHRWFDAKRIQPDDLAGYFGNRKPAIKPTAAYLPLPANEILVNPNLNQSEGY